MTDRRDDPSSFLCFLFLLDRAKLAIDGIFVTGFPYTTQHIFRAKKKKKRSKKSASKHA